MEFTSQSAVSRPIVVKAELSMILSNPVLLMSCLLNYFFQGIE